MFAPVDPKLPPKVLIVSNALIDSGVWELIGCDLESGRRWPFGAGIGSLAASKWRSSEDHRQNAESSRWSTRVGNPGLSSGQPTIEYTQFCSVPALASFDGVVSDSWCPGRYP